MGGTHILCLQEVKISMLHINLAIICLENFASFKIVWKGKGVLLHWLHPHLKNVVVD
jgi:hypothetical protein